MKIRLQKGMIYGDSQGRICEVVNVWDDGFGCTIMCEGHQYPSHIPIVDEDNIHNLDEFFVPSINGRITQLEKENERLKNLLRGLNVPEQVIEGKIRGWIADGTRYDM